MFDSASGLQIGGGAIGVSCPSSVTVTDTVSSALVAALNAWQRGERGRGSTPTDATARSG